MPKGHSCCIVGCSRASHKPNGLKNDGVRLFRIPLVKKHQGNEVRDITERRRRAWVAAIRRPCITFEHCADGMRVCDQHFHSGKPAYEMMERDPDWAPSLHLGHAEVKQTDTGRHNRQLERSKKKQLEVQSSENQADASEETNDEAVGPCEAVDDCDEAFQPNPDEYGTQTDLTGALIHGMEKEINRLLEENRQLKEKLAKRDFTEEYFKDDDDRVRYYTGLPCYASLMILLNFLLEYVPKGNRTKLSPFQLLMLTFMRLRLNLPLQHVADLFLIHRTTAGNAFVDMLNIMYMRLSPLICWPDRLSLRMSMPHQFVEAFGTNVAVIIDCFEVFIEKPSNLKAKAQTFSNYKHNHTYKYLIGITPQGVISFISKGWGGRTSDKHLTENCGFLNNLLPNDIILADRGFDINDSVGLLCAEVKIPSFTRGKCQMEAKDIEETRKIAHLRIHVERVIGNVVSKYTILQDTVPIHMALKSPEDDATFLDKIVLVCCCLTNMTPPIV